MARFEFSGIDNYISQLNKLQQSTKDGVVGKTVYAGAEVVADSVRRAIQALPVGDGRAQGGGLVDTVTLPQKAGLLDGFGISRMKDDDGFVNVKLGFDGYNSTRTEKYPRGQPNALIARSVNSGTTFRKKTKFVDKAVNSAKKAAETAMDAACSREIEKIMK
jgi:HK97 gp10 family phage protein|nr:MAG TPA: hypothetical protein [Caudoviricetes sp.]